jgi:hypothetical protein
MKSPLSVLLLVYFLSLGKPFTAHCDQALVSPSNYDSNQPIFFWSGFGSTIRAPVQGTFVQVLGGNAADRLSVLMTYAERPASVFPLTEPGFFDFGGLAIVPGVEPRAEGYFQVRAWRGDESWEAAQRNPQAFTGQSAVFRDQVGILPVAGDNIWPAPLLHLPSFTIVPVPEFSCAMLLSSSLAIMLIRVRCLRKERTMALLARRGRRERPRARRQRYNTTSASFWVRHPHSSHRRQSCCGHLQG